MNQIFSLVAQRCATVPAKSTSKKGVAEFGHSNPLAAQSRNTAQSCGFFVRAQVLAARMGERKLCRLMASASGPVDQPVRAASSFGHGVAVAQNRNWRPHMAHQTTAPTPGNIAKVLRAILAEVTPGQRPYSGDSYLPGHLIEAAQAALAGVDQPAHQHAHNALSTACWHIARGEAPQALSRLRRAQSHIMAGMKSGRA